MQTFHQSPRDPNFFQNPFEFYKKIRCGGTFALWADYKLIVTCDYTTVNYILRDKKFVREPPSGFFSGVPKHLMPFYENESRSMLEREPPYHTVLKSLVAPFFTRKKMRQLKSDIGELSLGLFEKIQDTEFDLISNFSQKFPVIVIAKILGVPEFMAPQLVKWSNDMVAMYQARRNTEVEKRAVSATIDFSNYVKELLKEKRINRADDLISFMISENELDAPIKEEEIISTIILLLNAGHEATVHTISNGVKAILESQYNPADLIKNPQKLAAEVLRYATPLHLFTRYCTTDTFLKDHAFKAGEKIGLLLAAANRDPAHFSSPESFNPYIDRKTNLALGAGIHFCLGAHLARVELEIALETLFTKFPNVQIRNKPEHKDNFHFFSLKQLILKT